jgi:N6-adenosine-specific RNA methylase IME4
MRHALTKLDLMSRAVTTGSKYEIAQSALAEAKTLDEVKTIHDTAAAMEALSRRAKDKGLILDAIELRTVAARRFGEMVGEIKHTVGLSKGGRPAKQPVTVPGQVSDMVPTLTEIGIDRKFSSYTQRVAAVPEPEFKAKIAAWREREETNAQPKPVKFDVLAEDPDVRRAARRAQMRDLAANPLLLPQGPFAAGVADPPWENPDAPIGQTGRHYRDHYATMTPDEIVAFTDGAGRKPRDIFAPHAFLALWVTRHILAIGAHLRVLEAWGFEPRTVVTWNKEIAGMGNGYTRDVTEHIVFAVRGKPAAPGPEDRVPSLFDARKTSKHSEKPDWPQRQIEIWFPNMSFVELFARALKPGEVMREGWAGWGNEAPQETEAAE